MLEIETISHIFNILHIDSALRTFHYSLLRIKKQGKCIKEIVYLKKEPLQLKLNYEIMSEVKVKWAYIVTY